MIGWLQRTGPLVHRLPALAAWVAIAGAGALAMAALLSGVMARSARGVQADSDSVHAVKAARVRGRACRIGMDVGREW